MQHHKGFSFKQILHYCSESDHLSELTGGFDSEQPRRTAAGNFLRPRISG
jgi:hypothetical protein